MYREIATQNNDLRIKGDLKCMAEWCKKNKLDLNIDKFFIISLRRSTNYSMVDYP